MERAVCYRMAAPRIPAHDGDAQDLAHTAATGTETELLL